MKMTIDDYNQLFDDILSGAYEQAPYDQEAYLHYVKLNKSRTARWNKQGEIGPELRKVLESIDSPQKWVLITEPWCGDAANSVPFIAKMAKTNPLIELEIQLRDSAGSEIDDYLTNGGKSIPKLVVRDGAGKDLFTWGPRPTEAQEMAMNHKTQTDRSKDEKYGELLQWYRQNNGQTIQNEIMNRLQRVGHG